MEDCETYLGLPIVGGKSKVNTLKSLQEKITKRVIGWKEKFISKPGREILIKAVAQAIPTYTMGIFKIPKALCDAMNSTIAKYWWGQTKRYDFFMLLWMMVDRLALHDLEKWAVTSWAIWNARNKYYFERIQIHPKEILNGALGFLHEY